MIQSSNMMKVLAVALAISAHAAFAVRFAEQETVKIEGGAGATVSVLGNSFADMAAGTLQAVEPPDITEAQPPTEVAPPPVEAAPMTPAVTATPPVMPTPTTPPPDAVIAALPQAPVVPDAVAVERVAPQPAPTIAAQTPETAAVSRSKRPVVRDRAVEARNVEQARQQPEPQPEPQREARRPEPTQPAPRGNAQQNARQGSATGQADATSSSQGAGTRQARAQGNAAASNYPGLVMRKISRVSKPRVGARGSATVRFSIGGGGGLSAVGIARSSGDARVDEAALTVIRRAAPFSPPPPGARRTFSIEIKTR